MVKRQPLHNFLFQSDPDGFYSNLSCHCTPWIDVCVILHLIRRYRPKAFLEIGTHRGHTTKILAEKFPEMQIVTVDPGNQIQEADRARNQVAEYPSQSEIGECARTYPNVRILKQRIEEIDWSSMRFDMVFVDGDHRYSAVLRDTAIAFGVLRNPGIIVWHDYNNVRDVNLALDSISVNPEITSIPDTWIAYYSSHS